MRAKRNKKQRGPVYVAKQDAVRVPVYHRLTKGYDSWEVPDYTEGRRRLRSFSDEAKATDAADKLAMALARGDATAAAMRAPDAASFGRAMELIRPLGIPLELVAANYTEAVRILGDGDVLGACRYAAAHNPKNMPTRTVSEVVEELLAHRGNGNRSKRHVEDLRSRLRRFAGDFQVPIASVSRGILQAWFDGLKKAPQTVRNFRAVVNNLFEFAKARGYVRANPVEETEQVRLRGGTVEVYTAEEIVKLLAAASPAFLPALAIQAFTGIRAAELWRLDWRDVQLDRGHVTVSAEKAKTAARRIVPIPSNLSTWLAPYAKATGRIWPGTVKAYYGAARKTAEAAQVPWRDNGLRHSYASHRLAVTQDAPRVALECGNSVPVIHSHYRELVSESDGKRWFEISPATPENVVSIRKAS